MSNCAAAAHAGQPLGSFSYRLSAMSLIAELRRRKVFKVGAAYLVVAWLLIQVVATIAPQLQLPEWAPRLITLMLLIGFPIALVMAWAFEVTPEGVRLDIAPIGNKRMYTITALLAAIALGWYFLGGPASRSAATEARSIAVLPFVNMSGDPSNEYFSDGLAETTLDLLAQVPDLKVIARTSSFAFKGKGQDARQIGAALGTAHLLEGSVQRAADTLRITVQVIRVADGSHLWSHHYDRPMVDVFSIQDEIANHVVQELEIALPASQQQRLSRKRTDSVEAYQEYLKGIALLPNRRVAELRQAVRHFESAIALDPGFAQAYFGASEAYGHLAGYEGITAAEQALMNSYADRALGLAPDSREAHIELALRSRSKGDLPGAEREYRRALDLAPSYATGYKQYAEFLYYGYGRVQEALAIAQRAAAFDPLSPIVQSLVIDWTGETGRLADAEVLLAKLHADHPDFAAGYARDAKLALLQGDLARGLRAFREQRSRDPAAIGILADGVRCEYLWRFGALEEARRCVDAVASSAPDVPDIQSFTAPFIAFAGDWAGALSLLEKGVGFNPQFHAVALNRVGRYADAVTFYRRAHPELFADPPGKLYPGQATDVANAGIALVHTGAQEQGQSLLRQALQAWSGRAHVMDGAQWDAVTMHVALGENEQAFDILKQGVGDGYFLDLVILDGDPLLAELRRDPRYEQILAPARAKVAEQMTAARAAGLL
jgi:TolB-like protein/Tfp pilus assembly protein PilF